ncbi:MAG: urease accessory protein [Gammaproteobacteria bacterium]|jgi:urease accessory protein
MRSPMHEFTHFGHHHDLFDATVTLDYERRQKSRQRVVLDNGAEAGIVLSHGEKLTGGCVLRTTEGYCVRVVAGAETLSAVYSEDAHMLSRASYHLGNRHVPVQIDPDCLRYLRDHVLDDMIRGLGLALVHESSPFEPEAGAYAKHDHSHAHDDGQHHTAQRGHEHPHTHEDHDSGSAGLR